MNLGPCTKNGYTYTGKQTSGTILNGLAVNIDKDTLILDASNKIAVNEHSHRFLCSNLIKLSRDLQIEYGSR
jgi:hypothetical protein